MSASGRKRTSKLKSEPIKVSNCYAFGPFFAPDGSGNPFAGWAETILIEDKEVKYILNLAAHCAGD